LLSNLFSVLWQNCQSDSSTVAMTIDDEEEEEMLVVI
jgi:hypothetical protein